MKRVSMLVAAVALIAASTVTAQMKPKKPVTGNAKLEKSPDIPITSAKRISIQDAVKLSNKGEAVFVDVRSISKFADGHIKGALSIPQSRLQEGLMQIPPKKTIITYCACPHEESAAMAVLYFNYHGIKDTAALVGGWNAWQAAHLPVERFNGR